MADAARLAEMRVRLADYLAAEKAILSSQSYMIEGMTLTRANLADVQRMITKLEKDIAREEKILIGTAAKRRRTVIPKDW